MALCGLVFILLEFHPTGLINEFKVFNNQIFYRMEKVLIISKVM